MTLQELPGDALIPPAPEDPDVVRILFTVHLDRDGLEGYRKRYPDFRAETPYETLVREAVAAWEWDLLDASQVEARRI